MARTWRPPAPAFALVFFALLSGCYKLSPSDGGAQATFKGERMVQPADVALPEGYRIEVLARGLTFPTGVTVDGAGVPWPASPDLPTGRRVRHRMHLGRE